MHCEDDKAIIELDVFRKFAAAVNIGLVCGTERKGNATVREPDIICELEEGEVCFELTEACSPEFAAAIAEMEHSAKVDTLWGEDASIKTLKKKMSKVYRVTTPVELVIYTAGRTVLSDETIVAKLLLELSNGLGQFRRIWFFGDEVQLIASSS